MKRKFFWEEHPNANPLKHALEELDIWFYCVNYQLVKETDFREIVNENQDRVYNACLGFMKNDEEAQDMVREVFIHVYQNIVKFKGDAKLSAWIYRITTNKCLEEIRRKSRKKRYAQLSDISDEVIQNQVPDFFHPWATITQEKVEAERLLEDLANTVKAEEEELYRFFYEVMKITSKEQQAEFGKIFRQATGAPEYERIPLEDRPNHPPPPKR